MSSKESSSKESHEEDVDFSQQDPGAGYGDDIEFGGEEETHRDIEFQDLSKEAEQWAEGDKVCTALIKKKPSYICIDYPVVIKNIDRALQLVGGQEEIKRAALGKLTRLLLKFRPEDPYSKPVSGVSRPSNSLLIKVLRRKRPPGSESSDNYEYKVEVIGEVCFQISFDGPCDYQYLPVTRNNDGSYNDILSSIVPAIGDKRDEYMNRDIPLFLPPFVFSRREQSHKYFMEDERKEGEDASSVGLGKSEKKKNFYGTLFVDFDTTSEFPSEPSDVAKANKEISLKNLPEEYFTECRKIFDLRPIWTKTGFMAHLDKMYHTYSKMILPLYAFFFSSGPWRWTWCLFGYDPRQNPSSKIYQTIDYRMTNRLAKALTMRKRCLNLARSYRKENFSRDARDTSIHAETETVEAHEPSKNLDFMYYPEFMPPYRQMMYQVCDIMEPKVQALLHKNDNEEKEVSEKDGWGVVDFTIVVRSIIAGRVETIIEAELKQS